ncbi:MAG: ABC transporter ATP-binding protein [Candidatus Gracilibacteria bacterium]|nr:ABC transporter ATP-binding protein [Candidatus Gracilibacteria bacterium]MDD2909176.1 ABC transporter ATP-binding protein [Candidatus Gracilibacteria bacterium]
MLKNYYEKFKILINPIKYVKKDLAISLIGELYDGFQSIIQIQILAFIITAVQSKNLNDFYHGVWIFIGIEIVAYFFMFIAPRYFVRAFYKMGHMLNTIYLAKFINLDNNKIESLGTGRAFSIITKGIDSWIEIILARGVNILTGLLSILYAFGVIAYSGGWKYFLVIFSIFVILFGIVYYGINLSLKYRKARKELNIEYDRNVIKIVMSKFEILQNNRILTESNKLKSMIDKILTFVVKEEFVSSSWNFAVRLIFAFIQLFVFFWLGLGVIKGEVSFSYFILVNGLVNVINKYLWGFSKEIRTIGVHMVEVDKLLETFDNISEIPGINNPTPFTYKSGDININNITYGYSEDNNIFTNFSLNISGGKKTALVGDSGSGKTTLMKLIAGYIHPKNGDISVDNQNMADINLISYYKNIGYLTQEPSVFDGTIIENLLYALDREPTQDELIQVIKNSKCDFIYELPNSLETEIGERGVKLSGGQKQRLAIAKIMLKNPNIILLDEPTSALDSISEQIVSEAFHNLFIGRTVIVIAHRLQTVKESDEILVFKAGEIIERGNHETLSHKENGEYKKMLDLQTSF